ncbi:MAG TPA: ORF6N domain-containing protein [Elusimicrobiota bacterium]|nr:ORF6N domain-containing protein [Elusimicrobiota bacterium]
MGQPSPAEAVERRILIIRGHKVMIDRDLAELYGVPTWRLNEQVKRNIRRFPEGFMFRLNRRETLEVIAKCDHLQTLKFSRQMPLAFTEHGIAMLSSVLRSERAIRINVRPKIPSPLSDFGRKILVLNSSCRPRPPSVPRKGAKGPWPRE